MTIWGHSFLELFTKGGPVMWALLACAVTAIALTFERAIAHFQARLNFDAFRNSLERSVKSGDLENAGQTCDQPSPVATTAAAYLQHLDLDDEARASIVQREGAAALEKVEQRLRGLSTVAHISTLIGLLGTVAGLVGAFHAIELADGQVQSGDLAAGIWAALLTTVFGLTIAIPSYLIFHFFESRADRIARQMSFIVSYLDQWFGKKTERLVEAESIQTNTAKPDRAERRRIRAVENSDEISAAGLVSE